MYSGVEEHVYYQIANAPIRDYPYPHIYVESVFPPDFYQELRRNWPTAANLVSLGSTGRVAKGAYPERFIMPLGQTEVDVLPAERREFWSAVRDWMLTGHRFVSLLVEKFGLHVQRRFGENLGSVGFTAEALVVR